MRPKKEQLATLGSNLARIRKRRGLTLERCAFESGISKGNLSEIESGRRDCRLSTLLALSETLEVSVAEIIQGV